MNVILLEQIHKLGNLGDNVNVKAGYGRNYLIPQGKAVSANARNIAQFKLRKAELEKEALVKKAEEQKRATALESLNITIPMLVSEEDKLYGSVGVVELIDAISAAGGNAAKQEVQLPNGPIRTLGEHTVELHLHHGEIIANIKVSVING